MYSLSKALRFVPRIHSFRPFASTSPQPVDELIDALTETHNNQLEEQPTPRYSESNLRVWDPTRLKPIEIHKTMEPNALSMKGRFKRQIMFKRPYLGPPAAESRRRDIFHQLGIDPLRETFNCNLLSHYVTDMGRVNGRADTGLTWRSQRRLTKAIRRAKMMGIMPLHSKRTLLRGY